MDTITPAELAAAGGAANATHAVFHKDNTLYFCVLLPYAIEDIEAAYWRDSGGYIMKRVVE